MRIAGVKVGTIGEVVREGDDVRAELILSADYMLHEDVRVDMRPHTLFEGSNFVDVSPGSPSAPVLEEGSTIPIEQTTNYVTLDEALRVLRPEIRTSLKDLAEVGSKTLKGEAIDGIQKTLKEAPDLTKALAPAARAAQGTTRTELAGTIQGFSRTVDEVAEREEDLIPIAQRANATMAALTVDGAQPLDDALVALPKALRELEATAPIATDLVDRLDRLAVAITPALPDLALASREAVPVLEDAIPVLIRAAPIIEDARQLATRLGKAKGGLTDDVRPPAADAFEVRRGARGHHLDHGPRSARLPPAPRRVRRLRRDLLRLPDPGPEPAAAPGHALRISTYFTEDAFDGAVLPRRASESSADDRSGPGRLVRRRAQGLREGGHGDQDERALRVIAFLQEPHHPSRPVRARDVALLQPEAQGRADPVRAHHAPDPAHRGARSSWATR